MGGTSRGAGASGGSKVAPVGNGRTAERIRHHYDVEVELAGRLRSADRPDRARLYGEVYDELFRRVPDHPQLQAAASAGRDARVRRKLRLVGRFLRPETRFLELGCGDGAFLEAVASRVAEAIGVEVSEEIAASGRIGRSARLVISDGVSVPVPPRSVDVAFSDQLMEHLHPDDARDQLRNVAEALAEGGWYVCSTPSRLSGPHDVSQFFDDIARGFHLREYDLSTLRTLVKQAGFRRLRVYAGGKGRYVRVPAVLVIGTESVLGFLSPRRRRRVARWLPVRAILGLNIAAQR